MRSQYFFPTPNLPVRPAQLMGGQAAKSKLANYGMNIGPMVVTWLMRFVYGKTESWTGKALSNAHQRQRREARQWESPEDRAARKAARKAAKRAAKEEAVRQKQEAEQAEAIRRQQAADAAHASLFPPHMAKHSSVPNDEAPPHDDIAEKSRRGFQQQMDDLDMNDLD